MSKTSVFCLVNDEAQACRITEQLQSAGFSNNDISVLLPDKSSTRDFAHEKGTKAPEGATTGAGAGAVLGGALGWLAGIGSWRFRDLYRSLRRVQSWRRSAARPWVVLLAA